MTEDDSPDQLVVRCATSSQPRADEPTLGEQVRRLRIAAGLTQQELANRIGSSQPAVARLEAGSRLPTLPTLEKLARALGHDLHLLVPGTPQMSA